MLNINNITPLTTTTVTRESNGKMITQNRVAEGTWLAKGDRITERGAELFRFVEYLVGTGKTIAESCRILSEKYEVSEGALISGYGKVRDRMNDIGDEVGVPTTKSSKRPARTHNMTYAEALDFYLFVKNSGINIINCDDR